MAKLDGVTVAVAQKIEYEGALYTEVKEDAKVCDIVRHNDHYSYMPRGSYYRVTRVNQHDEPLIIDEDGDDHIVDENFTVFRKVTATPKPTIVTLIEQKRDELRKLNDEITALQAKHAEESQVNVGDYARVIGNSNGHSDGTIVYISQIDENNGKYYEMTAALDTGCTDWFTREEFEKITPAEAKAALMAQVEALFIEKEAPL